MCVVISLTLDQKSNDLEKPKHLESDKKNTSALLLVKTTATGELLLFRRSILTRLYRAFNRLF
jgi:hypothetical protein